MSTPARIAERHDPLFRRCMAHVTHADLVLMAALPCRKGLTTSPFPQSKCANLPEDHVHVFVGTTLDRTAMYRDEEMRSRLHALNAAQDRAAMANAGDEGERAA